MTRFASRSSTASRGSDALGGPGASRCRTRTRHATSVLRPSGSTRLMASPCCGGPQLLRRLSRFLVGGPGSCRAPPPAPGESSSTSLTTRSSTFFFIWPLGSYPLRSPKSPRSKNASMSFRPRPVRESSGERHRRSPSIASLSATASTTERRARLLRLLPEVDFFEVCRARFVSWRYAPGSMPRRCSETDECLEQLTRAHLGERLRIDVRSLHELVDRGNAELGVGLLFETIADCDPMSLRSSSRRFELRRRFGKLVVERRENLLVSSST